MPGWLIARALQLYDGQLRFRDADGSIIEDQIESEEYAQWIGEASLRESYLKAPYLVPKGLNDGIYRVGPLARLNVVDHCGTRAADIELKEFRSALSPSPQLVPVSLCPFDRNRLRA